MYGMGREGDLIGSGYLVVPKENGRLQFDLVNTHNALGCPVLLGT